MLLKVNDYFKIILNSHSMYDTASVHTLTVFPLSAVSVKGFLSLSRLVSLLALRLKLAQAFQYALPFRRLCLLFLGGFLFFPDLPLPCGKVTIVLLHDSLRLAVGLEWNECK